MLCDWWLLVVDSNWCHLLLCVYKFVCLFIRLLLVLLLFVLVVCFLSFFLSYYSVCLCVWVSELYVLYVYNMFNFWIIPFLFASFITIFLLSFFVVLLQYYFPFFCVCVFLNLIFYLDLITINDHIVASCCGSCLNRLWASCSSCKNGLSDTWILIWLFRVLDCLNCFLHTWANEKRVGKLVEMNRSSRTERQNYVTKGRT